MPMPSSSGQDASQPKRPAPYARHSSQSSSHVSQSPRSPTDTSSTSHTRAIFKPPRQHIVGGGAHRGAVVTPRTLSFGKSLNKAAKLTLSHHQPGDGNSAGMKTHRRSDSTNSGETSPRPEVKRNVSSHKMKRNSSHTALKKNHSSGNLPRHGSSKNVAKVPPLKRAHTMHPTMQTKGHARSPPPSAKHPTVRFDIGDDEAPGRMEDHEGDDQWTEDSASISPETTRSNTRQNSVVLDANRSGDKVAGAQVETLESAPGDSELRSPPKPHTNITTLVDRTVSAQHTNGENSYHPSRPPDADAITRRLLNRTPHASSAISDISATVTPDARDGRVLSASQGSTLTGSASGRDLVSRFINGGGSSSGTPQSTIAFPQRRTPPPPEQEPKDLNPAQRNKSAPNFAHPSGTSTPTDHISRTQQKLLLQRASSTIEPQNLVPAVLPRTGTFNLANGGLNFVQAGEGGRIDPRLQRQFEQAAQEFRVVHRYRNPVADAVGRLADIPGSPRRNRGTKAAASSGPQAATPAAPAAGKQNVQIHALGRDGQHPPGQHATASTSQGLGGAEERSDGRRPSSRRQRVSFELPGGTGAGEAEERTPKAPSSYGSEEGRNEAYEMCRRLWEMGEVVERG